VESSAASVTVIDAYASTIYGSGVAVRGFAEGEYGKGGEFIADVTLGGAVGAYGRSDSDVLPNSCGIVGHHTWEGIGVGAWSHYGDLIRGYTGNYPGGVLKFYVTNYGGVYADGGFNTYKSIQLPGKEREYRSFYSLQSTENRIEDFGTGELINGKAVVKIDPIFASVVDMEQGYLVFITPVTSEMVNLVVTYKHPDAFGVKGMTSDGKSVSCSFDYRIVARDVENRNARMEVVDIPEPVEVQEEMEN
jgi:hypothetical protein